MVPGESAFFHFGAGWIAGIRSVQPAMRCSPAKITDWP